MSDTNIVAATGQELTPEQLQELYGAGATEDFGKDDLALPFIRILQSGSPELKRAKPEFIEGAAEGEFYNTVTGERKKTMLVVPIKYSRRYTKWKPNRGMLVEDYGSDPSAYEACAEKGYGARVAADGNEISVTATYYVLEVDGTRIQRGVINMGGSQWRKARRWNSMMATLVMTGGPQGEFVAPPYARAYTCTTMPEQNDLGAWMGWKIEAGPLTFALPGGPAIVTKAKEFRHLIDSGVVVAAPPVREETAAGSTAGATADDENIPF